MKKGTYSVLNSWLVHPENILFPYLLYLPNPPINATPDPRETPLSTELQRQYLEDIQHQNPAIPKFDTGENPLTDPSIPNADRLCSRR
jgi:hypothetical protein